LGRKHKTFNRGDGESGEIRELKQKVKRLASDNKKLIAELKTLQDAFDRSRQFISKKVADISVEDLIRFSDKNLKQLEEIVTCKNCGSTKFSYIVLPGNRKVKNCMECNHREALDDISQLNSIEEVI
jgi:DNA-directed RNA polymerase subunit M/transcription elongation factor TFIIS